MRVLALIPAAVAGAFVFNGAAHAAPVKVAAFDFELYDTSLEGDMQGKRQDQTDKIDHLSTQIRDFLKSKDIEVVDVAPAKADIGAQVLRTCGRCPADIAAKLGADYSLMGYVQKVSNLILNINVEIRNTKTGEVVRKGSTDIRGNTDESWKHGAGYLMRNQILEQPLQPAS
ncbi:DUF3280 domain-containing protein [Methylopila sp. M107]|uniref:DUF3280 domain-containing protein n=1 Tax=Methylopila sp. M107 TaxID=1101190 RepID=UPI0003613456|nr:DUF3280 domain-containing protein [Methylopila sp. M107]